MGRQNIACHLSRSVQSQTLVVDSGLTQFPLSPSASMHMCAIRARSRENLKFLLSCQASGQPGVLHRGIAPCGRHPPARRPHTWADILPAASQCYAHPASCQAGMQPSGRQPCILPACRHIPGFAFCIFSGSPACHGLFQGFSRV